MNLLVDTKLGGLNSQGQVEWSLSTETFFKLTDPNTLRFLWALDQDSWSVYGSSYGLTGQPRLRVWIWRF
jgi:hypothetical protein